MRVAFVSLEASDRPADGSRPRPHRVAEVLAGAGLDLHVLGRDPGVDGPAVTVHDTPSPADWWRFPWAIRDVDPDLVVSIGSRPHTVLIAGWGARLARVPLVAEQLDGLDGRLGALAARRPRSFVAPSVLVSTRLQERGIRGDRITVVPPPIDYGRIERTEPAPSMDVVYTRRLDENAYLEPLLLALAQLRRRDWSATVIGDGPERGTFESLAADLRVDDRVSFAGWPPVEDRLAIYRGAHVFVQTARRCHHPVALARAIASGCVAIVQYHADSCAHELIDGRHRGIAITRDDDLADAIVAAGEYERRTVDDSRPFSRAAALDRYLEVFETDAGGT